MDISDDILRAMRRLVASIIASQAGFEGMTSITELQRTVADALTARGELERGLNEWLRGVLFTHRTDERRRLVSLALDKVQDQYPLPWQQGLIRFLRGSLSPEPRNVRGRPVLWDNK